jgi:valyl-tRNA synthetase
MIKDYSPSLFEEQIYNKWLEKNIFKSVPDERVPYTIVIPPPNVTGVLHMGHMLNNTIQDVLIRRARMLGMNACWVPGTDHASIATEAKVVQMLRERGIKKSDLTREDFLNYAWEWKDKYGGIILNQLKKLGSSCDWDRTRFTMEPKLNDAVITNFIDLYNKGLLYRAERMVNWDPIGQTALSDEEVIYKEIKSKLYYIKYYVDGGKEYITVATSRPETIFADLAVCVNPNDIRYQDYIGKEVLVPILGRKIPVITDDYVDKDFGTGCLKITPAHDKNDFEIAKKYKLGSIDIIDDEGYINEACGVNDYIGLDRFEARKKVIAYLEQTEYLVKVEDYLTQVGTSERTGSIIEPKLKMQWWVDMKKFISKNPQVLDSVMNDEIKFYPPSMKNIYKNWIENIKDWCISRQLWWGQRIPAWYLNDGSYVIAASKSEAIERFKEKNIDLTEHELVQDEDVLDTWFSSWLWPISVFDGFDNPNNKDINYYYPTNDLVTAPEIMYFWVARMIMAGFEWRGMKPFSNVYFTGIVRDKQRRKMSKSLGNSPDPLDLIAKYGADGVRMGMLLCAPAGNDILFDEAQVQQGRNFANKIWNANKLIKSFEVIEDDAVDDSELKADILAANWIENKINSVIKENQQLFIQYRLSEALMNIYKLIWDDFCSWYLEMIKPAYGKPISHTTYIRTNDLLNRLMRMLHPYMPFITEYVWTSLKTDQDEDTICVAKYPEATNIESVDLSIIIDIITKIREFRNSENISPKTMFSINLIINGEQFSDEQLYLIRKLVNIDKILVNGDPNQHHILLTIGKIQIYIDHKIEVNVEKEYQKVLDELAYFEGFLKSVELKLSNERFISNAKPELVDKERLKRNDAIEKIYILKNKLQMLNQK